MVLRLSEFNSWTQLDYSTILPWLGDSDSCSFVAPHERRFLGFNHNVLSIWTLHLMFYQQLVFWWTETQTTRNVRNVTYYALMIIRVFGNDHIWSVNDWFGTLALVYYSLHNFLSDIFVFRFCPRKSAYKTTRSHNGPVVLWSFRFAP